MPGRALVPPDKPSAGANESEYQIQLTQRRALLVFELKRDIKPSRKFVFPPFGSWSKTKVWELADDGKAVEHFQIIGDVFK